MLAGRSVRQFSTAVRAPIRQICTSPTLVSVGPGDEEVAEGREEWVRVVVAEVAPGTGRGRRRARAAVCPIGRRAGRVRRDRPPRPCRRSGRRTMRRQPRAAAPPRAPAPGSCRPSRAPVTLTVVSPDAMRQVGATERFRDAQPQHLVHEPRAGVASLAHDGGGEHYRRRSPAPPPLGRRRPRRRPRADDQGQRVVQAGVAWLAACQLRSPAIPRRSNSRPPPGRRRGRRGVPAPPRRHGIGWDRQPWARRQSRPGRPRRRPTPRGPASGARRPQAVRP